MHSTKILRKKTLFLTLLLNLFNVSTDNRINMRSLFYFNQEMMKKG